jgi:hypothetical protein
MLRLMVMTRLLRAAALVAFLLASACTSSSHTAQHPNLPPQSSPSTSSTSTSACARNYATTTAAESAVAGDLRFFGPRPVNAVGNFADLADNAPVALCLVPDSNGEFYVYGIPQATGHPQRLWVQNKGVQFHRPV